MQLDHTPLEQLPNHCTLLCSALGFKLTSIDMVNRDRRSKGRWYRIASDLMGDIPRSKIVIVIINPEMRLKKPSRD